MATLSSQTGLFQCLSQTQVNAETEKYPSLALLPIVGTILFYLLPETLQQKRIIQFAPQILAYVVFGIWACANTNLGIRLGLQTHHLSEGLKWGCVVGLVLGLGNTIIILKAVPALGGNITFLTQTPHAQIPTLMMFPWVIIAIAIAVELNFRGFLLGRLITLIPSPHQPTCTSKNHTMLFGQWVAIIMSALFFAFDPFMVFTFQHLHWIAVWDGVIWGWIWVRFRNLYTIIAAHAIEVMILYTCIRMALT